MNYYQNVRWMFICKEKTTEYQHFINILTIINEGAVDKILIFYCLMYYNLKNIYTILITLRNLYIDTKCMNAVI